MVAVRAPREKIPAPESLRHSQSTAPPRSPHCHAARSAAGNPDLTTNLINKLSKQQQQLQQQCYLRK